MRQLVNVLRLSFDDYYFLCMTVALLSSLRLSLWLFSLSKVLNILKNTSQSQKPITRSITISKIVWAVNIATRYTPGSTKCLAKALTVQVLMSRYGYLPEFRIGVSKGETGEFKAHAWIEYQGRIVVGGLSNLSQFIPLPSVEI